MAYVINPLGATHSVEDTRVEELLREGFRLASGDEVTAWYAGQGLADPYEQPVQPVQPADETPQDEETPAEEPAPEPEQPAVEEAPAKRPRRQKGARQ